MESPAPSVPNLLPAMITLPNSAALRNCLAKAAMSETPGTYDNHPTGFALAAST